MPPQPFTITPACGAAIVLQSDYSQPMRTRRGFSEQQGYSGQQAGQGNFQVSFVFLRPMRALIPQLEALAGKNVVQRINRRGEIQLTSTEPCQFVRFDWDSPETFVYGGVNDLYSKSVEKGVFTISQAGMEGLSETMTLTLFRGNWLWQHGKAVTFERNQCHGVPSGGGNGGGGGIT